MHSYEYVPKEEWQPLREELLEIIHQLQDEVRNHFTFQYHFVGSSKWNMITRERNGNKGFDFDVNLIVNAPKGRFTPENIRKILREGLNSVTNPSGLIRLGYDYTEDSTRVLTIKVKDKKNSRIMHSCDFCIVHNYGDRQQQYIHYNKQQNSYYWAQQTAGYAKLPLRIEWIRKNGLWQQVYDRYLYKKGINEDPHKRSRSIFAETINEVWTENHN